MHLYNCVFRLDFYDTCRYRNSYYHDGYSLTDSFTFSAPSFMQATEHAINCLADLCLTADITILLIARL